ncbi:MAG: bifunctional 4-hydroxy-2-oxoglutarate aldolase/2-dehydro-3-deoxy-phosphogluconate aldolase [Spirochaetota bacterium]
MARYRRMQTLMKAEETGLIPLFYHSDIDTAKGIAQSCVSGGARVVEFTNRGDFAIEVFSALEKYAVESLPDLILGVGSILDAPTAALFIAHGANFIVGPCFSEEVARLCNKRKIPYIPGCSTITEIQRAEEFGCEIIKIFPGEVASPKFIKAVKAPMPQTSLMPTGGVSPTRESLEEWFSAGAACVGIGSQLISKELLTKKDFASLAAKVRECVSIINEIRK